jgi:nitrite reductase (NO-forming)
VGGIALIVIAALLVPIAVMPQARTTPAQSNQSQLTQPAAAAAAPAVRAAAAAASTANLVTSVQISATEFKFTPNSFQVPLGQKISFTLTNTGVVEHDVTLSASGFTLAALPGQTATGEFTFDQAGQFDLFCSVPGHKDAGMRGTLTVVDPSAPAAPAVGQVPAANGHDMSAMPAGSMAGMPMGSSSGTPNGSSAPDIKPLPADLKPLQAPAVAPPITRNEPAYVKYDLTTQKVVAQMADGVAYEYWTFNGTVPGPMLRVREGDTVEIDLHNSADSGMMHSVDLHAVTGPGGGAKVTQVMPGEDAAFTFQALYPGVFVYHCATPMVAEHISSGMYGLIVVEPKDGLPKVDHEYYLMEGDFYLQGNRGDTGLRAFDLNKMLDERPDYVLFDGGVGSLSGDHAFTANVNETVRIFFGVGGPNLTSSFHVIGAVFDRVYPEGSLTSEPETTVQTTHVSAGGATMVELSTRVPGTYTIVDHSLGRMEKGAAAQLVVTGADDPSVFHVVKAGSGGSGGH